MTATLGDLRQECIRLGTLFSADRPRGEKLKLSAEQQALCDEVVAIQVKVDGPIGPHLPQADLDAMASTLAGVAKKLD